MCHLSALSRLIAGPSWGESRLSSNSWFVINVCLLVPFLLAIKDLLGKGLRPLPSENLGFFVLRGHPLLRSWPMVIANRIGVPSTVW